MINIAINQVQDWVQRPQIRVIVMSLLSAFTWFCWAYWANREYPNQAIWSGLSQGGVNLLTTFFGTAALEIFYVRIGNTLFGRIMCVFLVSSASLCAMLLIHAVAGTPNMALTIFPVYAVVILYCFSYIYGLHKIKNQYEKQEVAIQ